MARSTDKLLWWYLGKVSRSDGLLDWMQQGILSNALTSTEHKGMIYFPVGAARDAPTSARCAQRLPETVH
jgi:hypothetical protein